MSMQATKERAIAVAAAAAAAAATNRGNKGSSSDRAPPHTWSLGFAVGPQQPQQQRSNSNSKHNSNFKGHDNRNGFR